MVRGKTDEFIIIIDLANVHVSAVLYVAAEFGKYDWKSELRMALHKQSHSKYSSTDRCCCTRL